MPLLGLLRSCRSCRPQLMQRVRCAPRPTNPCSGRLQSLKDFGFAPADVHTVMRKLPVSGGKNLVPPPALHSEAMSDMGSLCAISLRPRQLAAGPAGRRRRRTQLSQRVWSGCASTPRPRPFRNFSRYFSTGKLVESLSIRGCPATFLLAAGGSKLKEYVCAGAA